MLTVAVALLKQGDDYYFQRRLTDTSQTNKLGCFGGQAEERETPRETILRKLNQETTLNIDEIALKFLGGVKIEVDRGEGPEEIRFNVFEGEFEGDFEAKEDEKVLVKEADLKSKWDEFTPGTQAILEHYEVV